MATLKVWQRFEVTIDGVDYFGGSLETPTSITVGEPVFHQRKTLTAGVTWDAWGHTSEDPNSDFDFLWCVSDTAGVVVEFTTDKGGEVGTELATIELIADMPLALGSDGSWANYTADFAAGTLDVIDRIRIRNPSGTANVTLALFT